MGTRALNRLSPTKFAKLRETGRHCDGGGLHLQITDDGTRSWIFRFQLNGRTRDMGLGSAAIIGLADARNFAAQCRALVARKIDPIEERHRRARQAALDAAGALTFKECALTVIEAIEGVFPKSEYHVVFDSPTEIMLVPDGGDLVELFNVKSNIRNRFIATRVDAVSRQRMTIDKHKSQITVTARRLSGEVAYVLRGTCARGRK